MKTVYRYSENSGNLLKLVLFVLLAAALAFLVWKLFPHAKKVVKSLFRRLRKKKDHSSLSKLTGKEYALVTGFTVAGCVVILLCCVFVLRAVLLSGFVWVNTSTDGAECASGVPEEVKVVEVQEDGHVAAYKAEFWIGEEWFELSVPSDQKDAAKALEKDAPCDVYYRVKGEENVIIRIDVPSDALEEESTGKVKKKG